MVYVRACIYYCIVLKLIIHIFTYYLDKAHQSSKVPSRLCIMTLRTTLQPTQEEIVKLLLRNERASGNHIIMTSVKTIWQVNFMGNEIMKTKYFPN